MDSETDSISPGLSGMSRIKSFMQPSEMGLKSFRAKVGDKAAVFVCPSRVTNHTDTKWPVTDARLEMLERVMPRAFSHLLSPALKQREPFVIPACHFRDPTSVFENGRYRKIEDFINRSGSVQDTLWFNELAERLRINGFARHKKIIMHNRSDIHDFFKSYVIPLIDSLRRDGFRPDKTGYESAAIVDSEGRLSKTNSGCHRFAICQVLELPRFPLRVVAVHAHCHAREVMPRSDTFKGLDTALARVAARHQ